MFDDPSYQPKTNSTGSMGPLIPLIIGAGSAIYNAISSNAQSNLDRTQSNANLILQNKANRDLQQQEFDNNRRMWDQANSYNSPQQQMARLKLAGLNPNLVYGNGNPGGNSSSSIPQYQAPTQSYDIKAPDLSMQMPNLIATYQDMEFKKAQIDNVKAQTDNTIVGTANDVIAGKFADRTLEDRVLRNHVDYERANYDRITAATEAAKAPQLARYQLDLNSENVKRAGLVNDKIMQDILFRKYENEWMKKGVTRSDNVILRMLTRDLGSGDSVIRSMIDRMKSPINQTQQVPSGDIPHGKHRTNYRHHITPKH